MQQKTCQAIHGKPHHSAVPHTILLSNNYPHINHKDGDKYNNNADNLEWCTPSMNAKHAFDIGLRIAPWKDKKLSKETCEKMSKSKMGSIPWNKGIRQKPPTHGTMTEYNYGCRCDLCKAENTRYCRVKRDKIKLMDDKFNELKKSLT